MISYLFYPVSRISQCSATCKRIIKEPILQAISFQENNTRKSCSIPHTMCEVNTCNNS